MRPLPPGELARRLAALPVLIEARSVELGSVPVEGYYGGLERPTAEVSLSGDGRVGRGENVDWTPGDQSRFGAWLDGLAPVSGSGWLGTIGELRAFLLGSGAHPHHRAAVEAAAVDLALGQASTDIFRVSGHPPRPVRRCRSIGREIVERDGPVAAVSRILEADPDARIKIDCPPSGWSEHAWSQLGAPGRIVVVDFKRGGKARQVALAHRHLPDAWLEDPPTLAMTDPDLAGRHASWRARIALDGYVLAADDLDDPPLPPAAVNVKAPRLGGPIEALRCLERCVREGWHAYMGGMFEVGAGRRQALDLASLYTSDAWNDLALLAPP